MVPFLRYAGSLHYFGQELRGVLKGAWVEIEALRGAIRVDPRRDERGRAQEHEAP